VLEGENMIKKEKLNFEEKNAVEETYESLI